MKEWRECCRAAQESLSENLWDCMDTGGLEELAREVLAADYAGGYKDLESLRMRCAAALSDANVPLTGMNVCELIEGVARNQAATDISWMNERFEDHALDKSCTETAMRCAIDEGAFDFSDAGPAERQTLGSLSQDTTRAAAACAKREEAIKDDGKDAR